MNVEKFYLITSVLKTFGFTQNSEAMNQFSLPIWPGKAVAQVDYQDEDEEYTHHQMIHVTLYNDRIEIFHNKFAALESGKLTMINYTSKINYDVCKLTTEIASIILSSINNGNYTYIPDHGAYRPETGMYVALKS